MSKSFVQLQWEDPTTGILNQFVGEVPLTIGARAENEVVLRSNFISRKHVRLELSPNHQVKAVDLNSKNGTVVNGQKISETVLQNGDTITLGPFNLSVNLREFTSQSEAETFFTQAFKVPHGDEPVTMLLDASTGGATQAILLDDLEMDDPSPPLDAPASDLAGTVAFSLSDLQPSAPAKTEPASSFPPPIFDQPIVAIADLEATGFPIEETTYLALGGGIGSFTWVDVLQVSGIPRDQIRVLGLDATPYSKYKRLCENSQIPDHERLRSDSGSTPDNVWGFPGYAVREIWHSLTAGDVKLAGRIAWQIFGEPDLSESFTPRAGNVYVSMEREMKRIGWAEMWRYGSIRAIRKTDDGRYVVAYSTSRQSKTKPYRFFIGQYVHVALGYPAFRMLTELTNYRVETGDFTKVVNAYEPHDHVYQELAEKGGTVLVRGRGIVASRIVQRIYETRQQNPDVGLVHLMRAPNLEGNKWAFTQRTVENHWEMQPYNWPKSSFGGIHREILEQAEPEDRLAYMADWGGTTTADRMDWRRMVAEGVHEGWYNIQFGQVEKVVQAEDGKIVSHILGRANNPSTQLQTDFIVDCTGLIADLDGNPVLKDLMETFELPRNPAGRFAVTNEFELPEMRNGSGRMYAAGVMTLGGPFAPVDSFLGLQYAAFRISNDLMRNQAPYLQPLTALRSLNQWLKWARGVQP